MQLRTFEDYQIDRRGRSVIFSIMYRGKLSGGVDLSAGTNDSIEVFRAVGQPDRYYVYSKNTGMPYVGVQAWDREEDGELYPVDEIFAQEREVEEYLGKGWEDRTDLTNAKKLIGMTYTMNPRKRKNTRRRKNPRRRKNSSLPPTSLGNKLLPLLCAGDDKSATQFGVFMEGLFPTIEDTFLPTVAYELRTVVELYCKPSVENLLEKEGSPVDELANWCKKALKPPNTHKVDIEVETNFVKFTSSGGYRTGYVTRDLEDPYILVSVTCLCTCKFTMKGSRPQVFGNPRYTGTRTQRLQQRYKDTLKFSDTFMKGLFPVDTDNYKAMLLGDIEVLLRRQVRLTPRPFTAEQIRKLNAMKKALLSLKNNPRRRKNIGKKRNVHCSSNPRIRRNSGTPLRILKDGRRFYLNGEIGSVRVDMDSTFQKKSEAEEAINFLEDAYTRAKQGKRATYTPLYHKIEIMIGSRFDGKEDTTYYGDLATTTDKAKRELAKIANQIANKTLTRLTSGKSGNKVTVEVRGTTGHYRLVAIEHTKRQTSGGRPLKFSHGFDNKYRTKAEANAAAKELRAFIRSGGDWKSFETARRFNPTRKSNPRRRRR